MTLILIIFSQLCLIVAVYALSKRPRNVHHHEHLDYNISKRVQGVMEQALFKAKLAEKMADRAFNMASSANVGIAILQKALATPRLMTKQQGLQNEVAKNGVDKLFSRGGSFDYLRPILSDEENDLLDQAEELHRQQTMNGHKE